MTNVEWTQLRTGDRVLAIEDSHGIYATWFLKGMVMEVLDVTWTNILLKLVQDPCRKVTLKTHSRIDPGLLSGDGYLSRAATQNFIIPVKKTGRG